jgi:hypothetical protein
MPSPFFRSERFLESETFKHGASGLDVSFKRQATCLGLRREFIGNVDRDYHVKTLARI